ncbi:MAG: ApbE family protein [candidate division BRC1 bacterium ADurb.BinA364]|nr:MAG: ApbE family protein [candidate division BRC1 bacterium ADurb.BinA364]
MQGRHILDPRTGRWAAGKAGAWALAPAAAEADALSTAFLVMNREEVEALCARRPEIAALLALQKDGGVEFVQFNEIP